MMKHTYPANQAWTQLLCDVLAKGTKVSPRQQGCTEVVCHTSAIKMAEPVVTVEARNVGYRFMVAEAWWILSGKNDVESIAKYSKVIAKFSNDGIRFDGAYGPRVVDQLRFVVDKICEDRDTRQAVIEIWRPNPRDSKDIPCTVAVQWMVRNGELHCLDTMRSSDCWLGWVYDVFNFTCLSAYILLMLKERDACFDDVRLGDLYLTAGSQHIYDRDREKIDKVLDNLTTFECPKLDIGLFANASEFLRHLEVMRDDPAPTDHDFVWSLLSLNKGKLV